MPASAKQVVHYKLFHKIGYNHIRGQMRSIKPRTAVYYPLYGFIDRWRALLSASMPNLGLP